jgi:thioredoxin reductase
MTADVIIIGGGPAGVSCALQLKRYGMEPLVIEKERIGGLLWNASIIENYPGFPDGIRSELFIRKLEEHIGTAAVVTRFENVERSEWSKKAGFQVFTDKNIYESPCLVVASGTSPVTPYQVPRVLSGTIFYDIRYMPAVSDKKIGIIGAGDAAFDYALNLAGKGNRLYIFNRGSGIRALPLLISRAEVQKNITYHPNHIFRSLKKPERTTTLSVIFDVDNLETAYQVDYLIFATGRTPATGFLGPSIRNNMKSLINSKKLLLIGDAKGGRYRQAAIAAGEGIKAAMIIFHEGN